jgi:hypothetical protein
MIKNNIKTFKKLVEVCKFKKTLRSTCFMIRIYLIIENKYNIKRPKGLVLNLIRNKNCRHETH